MNIVLINPPFLFKERVGLSHCIGLRIFSAMLKNSGHNVTFIDSLMLGYSNRKKYANGQIVGLETADILSRIPKNADIIGLSAPFSPLAPVVHDISKGIKSNFPDAIILMGGVYPSTQPQLALTSCADYIIVGEGESIIQGIIDGRDIGSMQGVYTTRHHCDRFESAEQIKNLDALPFPDCSIPQFENYRNRSPRLRSSCASLITSRGCPYSCEFCSIHPVSGWNWRARSSEHVLKEIDYLVTKHNIKMLEIEDDNFTWDRTRTIEILKGIIELNKKSYFEWIVPNGVRIDTLDEEVICLMKKANCQFITLALEHGDQEMLKIMNKKLAVGFFH